MRWVRLFLASHRTGSALIALAVLVVAAGVFGGHVVHLGQRQTATIPLVLLIPAALAAVIGPAMASSMRPWDDMALRRIVWARTAHLVLLLGLSAAALAAAAPTSLAEDHGRLAAVRNLAGLTGVSLFAVILFDAAMSWLPILILLGGALAVGPDTSVAVLWRWLFGRDHDGSAALTAVVLLAVGVVGYAALGERGLSRRLLRY